MRLLLRNLLTSTSNACQVGGCAIRQFLPSSIWLANCLLCGYYSPVWFRDRLFRHVLFEEFEVSFMFEAFVVSFSTLLHYNYCRVSHLFSGHCDHGCGQLVRIDPWLCIRSFSRRNSNKIAHRALDNKVMSPDSWLCGCCSCSRSCCCFSIQGC